jgi:hypothetical protein
VFTIDNGVKNLLFCILVVDDFHTAHAISSPDGSSPRGYSRIFVFEYTIKESCISYDVIPVKTMLSYILLLSDAHSALPMGVAPVAMMGCLQPIIGFPFEFFG